MKEFSIPMALVDFIPVILFAAAAVLLQRDLYNKMSKGAFALFAAGTINVMAAGALKALYKLLYAAGVCDFERLNAMFFPVQSIGFLLAGVGIVALLCHRQGTTAYAVAAPAVFSGTMIFVACTVAGMGCMMVGLSVIAARMKKKGAVALFVVALVCSLCMGYLSTKDFAQAYMNWMAEGVNIVGQGCLLAGTVMLHKAGLASASLRKS